jgi:transposase, IS30 family
MKHGDLGYALVSNSAKSEVAMTYCQITAAERYTLHRLQIHGCSAAEIARVLGRHRSTIGRELARNRTTHDGYYRPLLADSYARTRRSRSRRNSRFTATDWAAVDACLVADWSPEQITGWCARHQILAISHETIYRHVWRDKRAGGSLYTHLRVMTKQYRKGYGVYDSRGRLAGKRPLAARPAGETNRSRFGHFEGGTMLGDSQGGACVLTLVDRRSGYTLTGQLPKRTRLYVNARVQRLIAAQWRPVHTITVDNGTEFHAYRALEAATDARVYFATPHHAWERGTNENTNGLIRQYLPKRTSMEHLTQQDCTRIATTLNRRPRKRLAFRTPEECYEPK